MELIKLLNTIRDNASMEYQDRIPEANRNNMESIRYAMIDDDNIQVANEFMRTLLNKLVKSVVHTKLFTNPLKGLKKGNKPLGDTIEEIYSNFLKGENYDHTGANLLKRTLPDTKTVYHRMNYQLQYPVTVSRAELSKAFMSYDALETYITNTINSLYNSAELDEFVNTKQLIKSALDNKAMKVVHIQDPLLGKTQGESFIKTVKTVSGLMQFPSTEHNAYLQAQEDDTVAITTFSRKSEQVLILDTATDTSVAVDVLASTFNMSVAEFNDTRKIVIDVFPDKDIRAVLVDEAFFQIYDDLFNITSFYNGKGLYETFYLNVWQTLAYSILVNAVAFSVASDENKDGDVASYSVTYSLGADITSSNKRTKVAEGGSFSTTLSGTVSTCTVTMGGTTVADAYDSATNKISISGVTGDIVITAA